MKIRIAKKVLLPVHPQYCMAGIYIHIPFCKQACTYCDFHFSTSGKQLDACVEAIQMELMQRCDYLQGALIQSVYIGGGTPSLLTHAHLQALMQTVRSRYPLSDDTEITLEANPDDILPEQLDTWKALGINRLSVGVQSFFEEDLRFMNRAHTANQVKGAIRAIGEAGFSNFSLDLIFGYPLLTQTKWEENIEQAIQSGATHLSCYSMTVEQRTTLAYKIRKGITAPMSEGQSAEQYLYLVKRLQDAGYEAYEHSNFARPGFHSRHNSLYWKQVPYAGFGPSAHSYNQESRQWNIANNALYIKALQLQLPFFEQELLTADQQINEWILLSLRTPFGLSLQALQQQLKDQQREELLKKTAEYIQEGLMELRNDSIALTLEGRLIADHITSALFV